MRKWPRQERSAFTVDVIVEAATRLLGTEGRTLTTNRIAELAGVSIGSFYQYFGGKQAILGEIARRHLVRGEQAINEVFDQNPVGARPWQDVLYDVVAVVVAENRSHGPAHGRLRHLVVSAVLAQEYEALLERLAASLAAYLEDDGRPKQAVLPAATLAVVSIESQVHYLTQTTLSEAAITCEITDFTVRALSA